MSKTAPFLIDFRNFSRRFLKKTAAHAPYFFSTPSGVLGGRKTCWRGIRAERVRRQDFDSPTREDLKKMRRRPDDDTQLILKYLFSFEKSFTNLKKNEKLLQIESNLFASQIVLTKRESERETERRTRRTARRGCPHNMRNKHEQANRKNKKINTNQITKDTPI